MNGFYISVKNELLDPKHQIAISESIWLFLWLLDKMTSISEEGIGKVLGGRPITSDEVCKQLGVSERTYRRWIKILLKGKYINTLRTPYGFVISINKASKPFNQKSDRTKMSYPDRTKSARDRTQMVGRSDTNGTSNIRQYQDNTIDRESFSKNPSLRKYISP
jgi:hypothetical protein